MHLRSPWPRNFLLVVTAAVGLATAAPAAAQPVLPTPHAGSFATSFNFDPLTGRIVAFDGFNTFRQNAVDPDVFNVFGQIPAAFEGGTDPAFILTSLLGGFYLLGAGAGGSQFPDPDFNGNLFVLPFTGGTATLIANVPFHTEATFRFPFEVFLSAGVATFDAFTIEWLGVLSHNVQTVIDDGPGASGGVGVDIQGNIYAGIGFDANDVRTGEVRKFQRADVNNAILTNTPLDFDDDGQFVVQILSGSGLLFDAQGDMWVSGGDLFGSSGSFGFVAEIDPDTGTVLRQINPTGNPNAFFAIAIDHKFGCTIGITEGEEVFLVDACI